MDLDELKKSWNQIDEQLKDKKLIEKENIRNLKEHVTTDRESMLKARAKERTIAAWILIPLAILLLIGCILQKVDGDDLTYIIALIFAIPAFAWDVYAKNYLSKIRIEDMPLKEVITRFNKYHRWTTIETFVGFAFFLVMVIFKFIQDRVWEYPLGIIAYAIIWAAAAYYPISISKKEFKRLRRVRKNLAELKELDD